MTLGIWILIILVLILAPMTLLLPSAQQKIQIEQRTTARRLGIAVNILPKEIKPGLTLDSVSYQIAPRLEAKLKKVNLCLVATSLEHTWLPPAWGNWQLAVGELEQLSPQQQTQLETLTQLLPASCQAVELNPDGLTFWWRESQNFTSENLTQLAETAAELLQKLEV